MQTAYFCVMQNGRLAAAELLKACKALGDGSNFTLLLEHSVEGFELCQSTGRVLAVQTNKRRCVGAQICPAHQTELVTTQSTYPVQE